MKLYPCTRAQIVLPDGYNEAMVESLWPGAVRALEELGDSGILSVKRVGERRWLLFEHDLPSPAMQWDGDGKRWIGAN